MKTQDLKGTIRDMEVGQVMPVPIDRIGVVRAYASEIGLVMNRTYKTEADKENGVVTIKRIN